jgi:S-adenosylmethionine:diacylglycerol 3-amino-3-carboxypropyl transferase
MDWLAHHRLGDLANEWQAIVNAASPGGARVIWRSAAKVVDFVDPIAVKIKNEQVNMGQLLSYHHETAEALHIRDRVNTYGCFVIADLAVS